MSEASILEVVVGQVLPRVLTVTALIAVGVTLANLAVEFGVVDRVRGLAEPLTAKANLPAEAGVAVVTTAASPTAGYGMLATLRDSGTLDDRATLVAVTINTFFGFVQHIFTFYVPVLLPILGLEVGLMYVGARAAISLGITLTGVLAGAVLLSPANVDPDATPADLAADDDDTDVASDGGREPGDADADPDGDEPPSMRERASEAFDSTRSTLRRVVPRLLVVYSLVLVVVERYPSVFDAVTGVADPLTSLLGLPGAAAGVVGVFAVDTTSGAFFIAPLVGADGPFTARTAVATMLVGGIVSFAVSTFKRSIPFQYGIWGASFGSKVVALNTALKVVFIALALAVLLV
ncbi:nucleoside recognition domain-containing protein [Halorubellus sp. PRR65]|uniref:nucleoside recognition domain-containing protein n=1 Tax=Halorubellus sp. PRR65 TaxID=3098148 RepID=UPI002B262545|nr:nucleoside recognition domain-containing protein [Halorubellus sp. PRR65]